MKTTLKKLFTYKFSPKDIS